MNHQWIETMASYQQKKETLWGKNQSEKNKSKLTISVNDNHAYIYAGRLPLVTSWSASSLESLPLIRLPSSPAVC